jgi:hypothetical protein
VERLRGTAQDRLAKELRPAGAATIAHADTADGGRGNASWRPAANHAWREPIRKPTREPDISTGRR